MRFSDVREAAPDPLGGPSFPIARHVGVIYTGSDGFDPVLSDYGFVGYPPTEYQLWRQDPPTQPRLLWTVPDVALGYVLLQVFFLPASYHYWFSDTNVAASATKALPIGLVGGLWIPRSNYLWITGTGISAPSGAGTAITGGKNFVGIAVVDAFSQWTFVPKAANDITGFRLYRSISAFVTAPGTAEGTLIADETVLSHTTTSAGFTVPAQGSNATVLATDATWISTNSTVLKNLIVAGAGAFEIVSVAGNTLTLKYLVNAAGTFTRYNTHSGATINSGANIIPCSYSDAQLPSPEFDYRLVGLSPSFNYPNNDVSVSVQQAFQDFGIDWVGTGLPEAFGLKCTDGVPGLTNLTIRHTSCPAGIDLENFAQLVTASFPNLVSCGTFVINGAPQLTSLSLPVFVPANGQFIDFSNNALDATSVNGILARGVANSAYVSGTLRLTGGTNAVPTGSGPGNKATLIARGVNVTTN